MAKTFVQSLDVRVYVCTSKTFGCKSVWTGSPYIRAKSSISSWAWDLRTWSSLEIAFADLSNKDILTGMEHKNTTYIFEYCILYNLHCNSLYSPTACETCSASILKMNRALEKTQVMKNFFTRRYGGVITCFTIWVVLLKKISSYFRDNATKVYPFSFNCF